MLSKTLVVQIFHSLIVSIFKQAYLTLWLLNLNSDEIEKHTTTNPNFTNSKN